MIDKNSDIRIRTEVSLKEVILKTLEWNQYILASWLKIMAFALLCAVIGFCYSVMYRASYIAESTFVLEEGGGSGGLGQYAGVASMMGIDLNVGSSNGLFSGDNILELYRSRTMIVKALLTETEAFGKKQLLVDRYVAFNNLRNKWDKYSELKDIRFGKTNSIKQDSLLKDIATEIEKTSLKVLKPDKALSVINVVVRSQDELFAKEFNNQIVKNVNDFYIKTKTKKAIYNLQILQHQTDSVRNQLDRAISGVAASADFNPNPNPSRQILRVPSQRKQVDAEANKAILIELVKSLEMSKVSLRKETPLIQIIDEPILPLDKTTFGKLKGTVLGALIGGVIAVIFFLFKKIMSDILRE